MSDRIIHKFGEGKYTVIFEGSTLRAERHGEPWRSMAGDGMVLAMLQDHDDLWRKANKMECLLHKLQDPRYGLMPDVVTTIRAMVGEAEMPEAVTDEERYFADRGDLEQLMMAVERRKEREKAELDKKQAQFRDDLFDGKVAPSDILVLWQKVYRP